MTDKEIIKSQKLLKALRKLGKTYVISKTLNITENNAISGLQLMEIVNGNVRTIQDFSSVEALFRGIGKLIDQIEGK